MERRVKEGWLKRETLRQRETRQEEGVGRGKKK